MVNSMSKLTDSPSWHSLYQHFQQIKQQKMTEWFVADANRFKKFSIENNKILLDFSKNRITQETLNLLIQLALTAHLPGKIKKLFAGEVVNHSEDRAAMHMALRNRSTQPMYVRGQNVMPLVDDSLNKMRTLVNAIHQKEWLGFNGQPIESIINIGIGGSDLGPKLLTSALAPYINKGLKYYFFSSYDSWYINDTLRQLNPATTLVIIASKSFTTEETLANAKIVKAWQLSAAPNLLAAQKMWFGITTNEHQALEFDLLPQQIFKFWDWVGGRYSIWSSVGLIATIALGFPLFEQFLEGGYAMDQHFQHAELPQNMPVILALLDIWYSNFFMASSKAILPYSQRLGLFVDYLQQLAMESLGKHVDQENDYVDYKTGNIIWGGVGTNSQHSFHQLLMQGTHLVPVDFIAVKNNAEAVPNPLLYHCLAQSKVLLHGYGNEANVVSEVPTYKAIVGNCPSTTIFLDQLSPYQLGSLIALYEHKVFSLGAILNINPFDQWGVERGKAIARQLLTGVHDRKTLSCYDSSTLGLLERIK